MKRILTKLVPVTAAIVGLLLTGPIWTEQARAAIPGITGPNFTLTAAAGAISTADGYSVYNWGYGVNGMQYPGPTLIVNQGDTVNITLNNSLPVNTSIVFPGITGVTTTGGVAGDLTAEASANGGSVTYHFTASNPGTFQYHSGTDPDLQIEMGMFGALIVRPTGWTQAAKTAYGHPDSAYDREYLFLSSGMDLRVHEAVEAHGAASPIVRALLKDYVPVYWFFNGRNLPDDLLPAPFGLLPNQPYNTFPLLHPGERGLIRFISATKEAHPIHTHGNNGLVIAEDGRLLESAPGAGADLSYSLNTFTPRPGQTMDAIQGWTGRELGWDIYGNPSVAGYEHECIDNDNDGFDDVHKDATNKVNQAVDNYGEWCADHGKAFPVSLPNQQDTVIGGFYSGSPFLGYASPLPVGEGGLNPFNGFAFPWHSHHEYEVVNNDVFPGGMFTVFFVVPWDYPLDPE